jgi:hypothetical protein
MTHARPWVLWSAVLAPVTIVAHECAHLVVARLVGFATPTLHFSSVDPGPGAGLPPSAGGLVSLAGPVASAIMAVVACVFLARRGARPWSAALAVTAASRFVVSVPYTIGTVVATLFGLQLAPPVFDEYQAGTALQVSGNGLLALTTVLLLGVVWCVGRSLPRADRRVTWAALIGGTALGWAVWMLALGPVLLP